MVEGLLNRRPQIGTTGPALGSVRRGQLDKPLIQAIVEH